MSFFNLLIKTTKSFKYGQGYYILSLFVLLCNRISVSDNFNESENPPEALKVLNKSIPLKGNLLINEHGMLGKKAVSLRNSCARLECNCATVWNFLSANPILSIIKFPQKACTIIE